MYALGRKIAGVLILAVFICACSGSDGETQGSIRSSPLTGTLAGRPFTAKAALAKRAPSSPEKKSVSIYDVDATCAAPPRVDRYIFATPIWKVGAKQDVFNTAFNDLSMTPGLVGIAEESELEVVHAPTERGARGTLRMRARYKSDSVEGEVEVQICE